MSNVVLDWLLVIGAHHPFGHPRVSFSIRYDSVRRCRDVALLCAFALLLTCKVHAQDNVAPAASTPSVESQPPASSKCLPDGSGFLRARLRGSLNSDLDWGNSITDCTGAVRPTDGGIRLRFTGPLVGKDSGSQRLVLVFGIAALKEGSDAKGVPVNVTAIREGTGEFYGTQGDDKCTLDQVKQTPLRGIPNRQRTYRIVARGFCTEPARAITGNGAVLISRFDFAGRVDFAAEESDQDPLVPIS
jgi:hypothetical protein